MGKNLESGQLFLPFFIARYANPPFAGNTCSPRNSEGLIHAVSNVQDTRNEGSPSSETVHMSAYNFSEKHRPKWVKPKTSSSCFTTVTFCQRLSCTRGVMADIGRGEG
jgi:hypothetical protein